MALLAFRVNSGAHTQCATHSPLWSPEDVTVRFLEYIAAGDDETAVQMLHRDVQYRRGSMPGLSGRDRVARVLRRVSGKMRFDVEFHDVQRSGGTVHTRRTDAVIWGPLRVQYSVRGTCEVVDGRIVRWRDTSSWPAFEVALMRGLVGAAVPAVRSRMPVGH